jgi:TPR repeat protein
MLKKITLVTLCFSFFILSAMAQQQTKTKPKKIKISKALKKLLIKAKEGDAVSQGTLATVYRNGSLGTVRNYETALYWSREAAKQLDPIGIYNLAVIYQYGLSIPASTKTANILFKQAYPKLLNAISTKQAPEILYALGFMTSQGLGTIQNKEQALLYFTKSADLGHAKAQLAVGEYYLKQKNQNELAFTYIKKSAQQGERKAQFLLGGMYLTGYGTKKDIKLAPIWLIQAAHKGDPNAQYTIGVLFENGIGVKQSNSEALKWYSKSASQNNKKAQKRAKIITAMVRKALLDKENKK